MSPTGEVWRPLLHTDYAWITLEASATYRLCMDYIGGLCYIQTMHGLHWRALLHTDYAWITLEVSATYRLCMDYTGDLCYIQTMHGLHWRPLLHKDYVWVTFCILKCQKNQLLLFIFCQKWLGITRPQDSLSSFLLLQK